MRVERKLGITGLISILLLAFLLPKEASALSVSASGAVLMEQSSGRVLYENNAHEIRRIASITKILTAILAIESGKMEEIVKVSKEAVYTEGSSIYLQPGEKIKLEDLVYGLMLRSGNDAASAIAEHVGGSLEGFVFLMNQKAEEIGMKNTIFSNPHGLDDHEKHYSTPYDMALLTRYAMNDEHFRTISGTKVHRLTREHGPQQWTNKNRLLTEKYRHATGGKTGFTKRAGRTLITTASNNGMDLIAVTLNAPSDWNDHIGMYEYGFNNFQMKNVLSAGNLSVKADVPDNAELSIKKDIYFPLTQRELSDMRVEYQLLHPKELAKKTKGQVGFAIVHFRDNPVIKTPIYIKQFEKKEKESWWELLFQKLFSSDT